MSDNRILSIPRFAFIDDGEPGTWRDALAHSPTLKVTDYAGHRLPDADGFTAPVFDPFHGTFTNAGEAQDVAHQ